MVMRLMNDRTIDRLEEEHAVVTSPSEERVRLRGETVVHRRCATYRLRNRDSSGSRLGFPR